MTALDLALQARRAAKGVPALHFRALASQFHEAEIGQPEAGEIGGLALDAAGSGRQPFQMPRLPLLAWKVPLKALPDGSSSSVAST